MGAELRGTRYDVAWDANFDMDGLGDSVQINYDVAGTTLAYQVGLASLFS